MSGTINSTAPGAPYGWLVNVSFIEDDSFGEAKTVEVFGPRGISQENQDLLLQGKGTPFVMRDDDGIVYYKGRLIGEHGGDEPLMDYGMPNAGCTEISLLEAKETCLRCKAELVSEEDHKTGVCPDCWTEEDGDV